MVGQNHGAICDALLSARAEDVDHVSCRSFNRRNSRRACLSGRCRGACTPTSRRCSRCASRASRLASLSRYSACAALAGPRLSASASTSPACSDFAALQPPPLTSILPPSIACLATLRVLKKRAAHSHTSARTSVGTLSCRSFITGIIATSLVELRHGLRRHPSLVIRHRLLRLL